MMWGCVQANSSKMLFRREFPEFSTGPGGVMWGCIQEVCGVVFKSCGVVFKPIGLESSSHLNFSERNTLLDT